jgi:hypothetical protein
MALGEVQHLQSSHDAYHLWQLCSGVLYIDLIICRSGFVCLGPRFDAVMVMFEVFCIVFIILCSLYSDQLFAVLFRSSGREGFDQI